MSLHERRDILTLHAHASSAALITLVRSANTTGHKPGSRLLVTEDGSFAGTLSCTGFDVDVLHEIALKARDGASIESILSPSKETKDLSTDHGWDGEVDLLLEPSGTPEAGALLKSMQETFHGASFLVVTILPQDDKRFGRVIIRDDGNVTFASDHISTEDIVDLRAFARTKLPPHSEVDTHTFRHVFIERIAP